VVRRNIEHHFSSVAAVGWVVPALAAVPLMFRPTRRIAIALWASILLWLAVVAFNGQVRWQNERYTMPAVAWLLLLAAVGVAVLVRRGSGTGRLALGVWAGRVLLACVLTAGFVRLQAACMRDQIWFFGRACRNVRDQHVATGLRLATMVPKPKRVLVGDAGALLYASDLPGMDLIGLGGFHELPFARASVHGLGATLELLERVPREDWPDVMAIYPSWWGDLPIWFGRYAFETPVYGNVICGGASKVVYRTDWRALGKGARPRTLRPGEQVVDELDVADLVSEKEHAYEFPHPGAGFIDMKVLPDPDNRAEEMFDAGRRIPEGKRERFRVRAEPNRPSRLIVRTAPERPGRVDVIVRATRAGSLAWTEATAWREITVDLPPSVEPSFDVELVLASGGDWVDHHVWIVQAP
jgi:hypothetical protein